MENKETLERICKNISKLETRIHDTEDDLYHLRLEIETLIKEAKDNK